ncbi:MAG: bifunctional diaminohydroxyphosphoribosylaminopyrimidine deaminase/5-amino-6-(5-phosphoribosylamino)uracil reductase RibD [Flavobacteriaceae bacterium]|nr:bifunctional diaminohydroxyphosphoribosylaminopyrimidine deaminase/5-amino-6-(5-phosphoribosylamino)uracil reductase RibD [Flavobacteriaceae bacterium]
MKHEHYIKRCLEIAQKGIGFTRPNPSVGAVLVVDDKIIGEGFTSPYGGNHAEVNAIESVLDKELLKEATIYVTLGPCSHFGKTPPCSDLIIRSGIKKVVIGCVDSNSLVSGRGIERLKNTGIDVEVGILEKECRAHHKRFFTFHNEQRPYIILKWAESFDGFIAPKERKEQAPVWITNEVSRQLVHQWRSQEHAILVGTNTVLEDNPKLNVRNWEGENPIRIVIDRELKIPKDLHVYDQSVKTVFIYSHEVENSFKKVISKGLEIEELVFEPIDFSKPIAFQICTLLYKHQIQSLIVEGGAKTLQTFIEEGLWDEARVFVGDVSFEKGVKAPIFNNTSIREKKIQGDILKTFRND